MFKTKKQKEKRLRMKKFPLNQRIEVAIKFLSEKNIYIHLPEDWDSRGKKELGYIWSKLCDLDKSNTPGNYYF